MPLPSQLRPGEAPLTDKAAPTRAKGLGYIGALLFKLELELGSA